MSEELPNNPLKKLITVSYYMAYPLIYARVLIQLGYEPIVPRPSRIFFVKPTFILPNIFQYVNHIKSVVGFFGCYQGLFTKFCSDLTYGFGKRKVTEYFEIYDDEDDENGEEDCKYENIEEEEDSFNWYLQILKEDIIIHTAALLISHPFHVMHIRTIAQFIGKEEIYSGVYNSAKVIYKQNGFLGFFSGLIPRLLGEILQLILASGSSYILTTYVIENEKIQLFIPRTMHIIAGSVVFPFEVISNCMVVMNSGLTAGSPPFMPHYPSWIHCWMDLSARNQLRRGYMPFWRYCLNPKTQA